MRDWSDADPSLDCMASALLKAARQIEGLDLHDRSLDESSANGIEPFCDLYHWTCLRRFRIASAASCGTSKASRDHAAHVAQRLSDRVKHFFTINECFRPASSRPWHWRRCAGPQTVPIRTEPGPSQRRAGTRSRGASRPRPRTRRNQGRSGGECRQLHPCNRNACEHPRSRDRDARAQCRLSDGDAGREIHRCIPDTAGNDAPKYTAEDLRIISSRSILSD